MAIFAILDMVKQSFQNMSSYMCPQQEAMQQPFQICVGEKNYPS